MAGYRIETLLARHDLYEQFVEYIKRMSKRQLSKKSVINRLSKLEAMRRKHKFSLDDPNPMKTLNFVEKAGCAAATLNSYRFVIKQWMQFKGIPITDELKSILRNKSGTRVRKISPKDLLTVEERAHIIGNLHSPSIRAYLAALWDTACRPSEISSMTVVDVKEDSHGFVLNLHQTKFEKKSRPVRLLDPQSIATFSDWWAIHPNREDLTSWLFPNRQGNHLEVVTLSQYLRERFNEPLNRGKNKPKSSLNLYLYRKSRITHLLKERILSEVEIKTRVGHMQHSTMLEQYYAILDELDQQEAELRYLGVKTEKEQVPMELCPHCGAPNLATVARCYRCRQPLSEKEMVEEQKELLQEAVKSVISTPETLQLLVDAVSARLPSPEAADLESSARNRQEE